MVSFGSFGEVVPVSLSRVTVASRPALEIAAVATYDGRGHRIGEPVPLYASEDWETARAEFLFHHPALEGVLVRCTTLTGRLLVVDVIQTDAATAAGTTVKALTADPPTECQRFTAEAFAKGAEAVRLPSARREEDGVNLVVQRAAALASLSEAAVEYRRL